MKLKLLIAFILAPLAVASSGIAQTETAAQPPAMMKAIAIHEFGGPEVLKYEDVPRPEPKEDEVLIKVVAAGINPVDASIRAGRMRRLTGEKLPLIPGMDVAGVVEKAGTKITRFKSGDPVYAYLSFQQQGGYAEFAIAKENEMALKPKEISYEGAAAVPLAATTAWQALVDTAKIEEGQTVLIHGGSGGVGHFAIQIAKARGAKVIATASTPNQALMKELAADQTIDYTTSKFEEVVKDVDVVLDAVRGDALARSYGVVKKGGIIVSITGQPDPVECEKRGIRGESLMAHPDAKVLEELAKLIDEKKIKPVVSQVFPLTEAAVAHEQIATRHTRGKIVLKIADAPK
jgi:NADPH:quinone reductase-like Zn-dependent oxidoreductase